MKVAIDGPAGSGKSTIAHALAQRCGLLLLDTGAMYRSVTLACHERGVPVSDDKAVAQLASEVSIAFGTADDGSQTVSLDGRDVTQDIRTPAVDADVSAVSAIPAVREAMVAQQRAMGEVGDVVAEGRDIGTVVFPDAEVKIFLTADPAARAHRRALQRDITDTQQEEAILADLKRRDEADSTREVAPLRPAEGAIHIDSSAMTIEEEVSQIAALIDEARASKKAFLGEEPGNGTRGWHPGRQEEQPASKGVQQPSGVLPPRTVPGQHKEAKAKDKPAKEPKEADPNDVYYDGAMREYPLGYRALYVATMLFCGGVSKLFWPWRLEGGEELWNAEGGQMVIMNHQSMLDPVIIVVSDWAHGRRMRPIFKSEFNDVKIARWFFARVGGIPVKRGTADLKAVRRAQRALQRGEDILVFPEGTRIYDDDQEVTIHGGFALMAQLAKAPVLPVGLIGAGDGAPGGKKSLRPCRVFMRAGKALTFDELGVKGRKKQATEMERRAMERVYELRDALRAAHPGKL